jgi:hypothetical protein
MPRVYKGTKVISRNRLKTIPKEDPEDIRIFRLRARANIEFYLDSHNRVNPHLSEKRKKELQTIKSISKGRPDPVQRIINRIITPEDWWYMTMLNTREQVDERREIRREVLAT